MWMLVFMLWSQCTPPVKVNILEVVMTEGAAMSVTWVDENKVQMAPPDTWHTLSLNHLLETKNLIMDKVYLARGNQAYLKPLNAALGRLELLIAAKLADPRGAN